MRGLATLAALIALAAPARAQQQPRPAEDTAALRELSRAPGGDMRFFGSLAFGRGIRFNNPYRLATELGASAESVSATAPYLDLGIAAAFGAPDGIQHGGALHLSIALAGVAQQVLTPSYLLAYRGPRRFLAYGRLGPSFVLTPDPTFGGELAGGFAWFLTSRIGLTGEAIFDVFYGAGTLHKGITTYPILSGQLGLLVDYEVLP